MLKKLLPLSLLMLVPSLCLAVSIDNQPLNLYATDSGLGILALLLFVIAYLVVMSEEFLHLRKSKPVVLAAGIIWLLVSVIASQQGNSEAATAAVRHNLLEYVEIFLFLLVAMTYVNVMQERNVFEALRSWLVRKGFNYRQLFWITGVISFFLSPIVDNLTTALIMCAVVLAVGAKNAKFVSLACINIVVAANAGGAFSPFGDITTLMVWQKGVIPFFDFFQIFLPSVVNFLVPAMIMSFAVPKMTPPEINENCTMHFGAKRIISLFLFTIALTVTCHQLFHLPPALSMMTGLGLLQFFSYYLKKVQIKKGLIPHGQQTAKFDIFRKIARIEWDTLLFFYGVVLCVGGLATLGYLHLVSDVLYHQLGNSLPAIHQATPANIIIGILSALIDNIPVMFAVLTMNPSMSEGQWLLVTLTTGVGGSLLSIGSAAGVALMGQAKGRYTFFSHLKWTWAIALGYFASIAVHIWMNHHTFSNALGN